ncbi:MAG: amidohydrolase family protein [Dehalococcoidia bacterium]|nr:amidohydrolase family protein [Dehalococcoidia bacterium]
MAAVIDVWMQHPTPRFIQHDMFDSLRRWTRGQPTEGMQATDQQLPLELTIAAMDAAGVERGLIAAWYGPEGPMITNDEVAAFVAQYPERLVGVASVDLRRPVAAVRELRRAVRELGMRALRIVPWLWGLPPNDRRYYPLYAECVELDIPFCTQVGHTGPLRTSETGRPIPYIDDVALEFPDLVIVGGHIGYPWTNEMIALATKYPNVYIDTSAYTAKRFPPELVAYMRGHGRRKVMFATNYPMITAARALEGLDGLELDEEATELYLSGNARRVFGL